MQLKPPSEGKGQPRGGLFLFLLQQKLLLLLLLLLRYVLALLLLLLQLLLQQVQFLAHRGTPLTVACMLQQREPCNCCQLLLLLM